MSRKPYIAPYNKKRVEFSIGQIIRMAKDIEGFDVWKISALYYGTEIGNSAVELTPLSSKEHIKGRYLVPMILLEAAIKGGKAEIAS